MRNREDENRIRCDVFQNQFDAFNRIKPKMNLTRNILEKAQYAEELLVEVDSLMSCSRYDKHSTDCVHCKIVAGLHKRSADLIFYAKSLA